MGGVREALSAANGNGLKVIPGIELSVDNPGYEIHVLGYFINFTHKPLEKRLSQIRQGREGRTDGIIKKLNDHGIPISRKQVEKYRGGQSIGRPHIAKALVEMGASKSVEEAFTLYLDREASCYVPRERLTVEDAVGLIKNSGGVPVLAHPVYVNRLSELFGHLLDAGIMGIEAYYPAHTPQQTGYYLDLASAHGLCVTGGSDFHGSSFGQMKQPGISGVPHRVITDFIGFCRSKLNREVF